MVDQEMVQVTHGAYIEKAEASRRSLHEDPARPEALVTIEQQEDGYTKIVKRERPERMKEMPLSRGGRLVLDFGDHQVGYMTLHLNFQRGPQDSPAFIRVKFGEEAGEILERFEDYDGWISRSWIQEEYLHIDVLPAEVKLPRRYAFRYLELEVIDTSRKWELVLEDTECRIVSAVTEQDAGRAFADMKERVADLFAENLREEMERICKVSLRTLKNCMQDVFEDGPKRDRRLWLGDLRLQALADYASFKNYELVKRCLYLFAGMTRQDGKISACLFVEPKPQADNTFLFDYSLFFISVLKDYYEETGERDVLEELWEPAKAQLEIAAKDFDENGWIRRDTECQSFIDWKEGLDKQSCSQAAYIYAAKDLRKIAEVLEKQSDIEWLDWEIREKEEAARSYAWDESKSLFISGPDRQVSYATQVWMILAGVVDRETGKEILEKLENEDLAVGMVTPYMNHHYVEALFLCGEGEKAIRHILYYWGGMVRQGADTFWEVYNPENPRESPYGSSIVNSYCHAWSCTPIYFIWRYGNEMKGKK